MQNDDCAREILDDTAATRENVVEPTENTDCRSPQKKRSKLRARWEKLSPTSRKGISITAIVLLSLLGVYLLFK